MKLTSILLVLCLLVSCAPAAGSPVKVSTPLPSPPPSRISKPTVTPFPTPTRAPTWTPEPTATLPGLLVTPSEFARYYVDALRARTYGGGDVKNQGEYGNTDTFTRYKIQYPSDGLKITGFMNVPGGKGPYPVIIALHGYSNPDTYNTLDYTLGATDDLASQGYIVVHPNYRNFLPSDKGDALFRDGYVIDVLNLIALIRENAGKPGLFQKVNRDRIGLWGHSMGGEIALKVAVISPYIKAVLLYAPMSGDEQKNSQYFKLTVGGSDFQKEMTASPDDFKAISAETYYKHISAPIQLHHGTGDTVIPVTWSEDTCQKLKDAGVNVVCYYYDGADHTFKAKFVPEFSSRVDDFFARNLKK